MSGPHHSSLFDLTVPMQTLLDTDKIEFDEMVIAGDQAGMLFRQVMLDWVNEEHGSGTT
ncbi:MAG: hypothetical protein AAGK02_10695 [Pseudomonadota bacterium]